MPTDLEKLVVQLSADVSNYNNVMKKALATTNSQMSAIEKRINETNSAFSKLGTGLSGVLSRNLAGIGTAVAAALSVREIVKAADEWTNVGNRLKTAGLSGKALADAQQEVVRIAVASNAELGVTAGLYSRLIPIAAQYGFTQQSAAKATEAISQALAMAGVDAGTASGAIKQLGQALGSGVLRGDEFNSVLEALGTNSPIIKAIAREFGVAATELRGLAEKGELLAPRVFAAIIKAGPEISRSFSQANTTVSAALGNLQTAFGALIGKMDQTIGASARTAQALQSMANTINSLVINDPLADARSRVDALQAQASGAVRQMGTPGPRGGAYVGRSTPAAQNLAGSQLPAALAALDKAAVDRINAIAGAAVDALGGMDLSKTAPNVTGPYRPRVPQTATPPWARPGYVDPNKKENAAGARIEDRYKADIQGIRDRTAALDAETAAVGKSTFEAERLRAVQELTAQARADGVKMSPQIVAQIDAEAEAYARAADMLEKTRMRQQEMEALYSDLAGSFVNAFDAAIVNGEKLGDVLQNLKKQLLSMALNAALKPLLGSLFNGLGGLFSGGVGAPMSIMPRAIGGPVSANRPYIVGERGPELIVPRTAGVVIPNSRMGGAGASGAGGGVSVTINNNAGADVQQKTSRGPDGRTLIAIEVNRILSSGRADSTMQGRFGLKPKTVTR